MAQVEDVARLIVERLGTISTMKLQKLLYYCQGWHLAWDGEPLFDAPIEAWANGPVVKKVYDLHRGQFTLRNPWPEAGDTSRLQEDEIESIEAVLDVYGTWDARQLVAATHDERPWLEARGELPDGARSNRVIELDTMQDFFGSRLEG